MQKEKEREAEKELAPRINCVFFHDKACPVRVQQGGTQKETVNILKYLKPESASIAMVQKGMSAMEKMMSDRHRVGSGVLSDYCKSCPFLKVWSRALPIDR